MKTTKSSSTTAPKDIKKALEIAENLNMKSDSKYDVEEQILKVIKPIEYYHDHNGITGIGFKKTDGKLVEFRATPEYGLCSGYEADEITVMESVEWLEKMEFASERFDYVSQINPEGRKQWHMALQQALK